MLLFLKAFCEALFYKSHTPAHVQNQPLDFKIVPSVFPEQDCSFCSALTPLALHSIAVFPREEGFVPFTLIKIVLQASKSIPSSVCFLTLRNSHRVIKKNPNSEFEFRASSCATVLSRSQVL